MIGIKLYAIIAGSLILILGLFGFGWYCGSLSGKSQVSALQSAQAQLVAETIAQQQRTAQAEATRLNGIIATYEQAYLAPVDPGIAHSVYKYALSQCPVSSPASTPGGIIPASPKPTGPEGVEQALDGYIQACSRDALRLNAIQAAWPK